MPPSQRAPRGQATGRTGLGCLVAILFGLAVLSLVGLMVAGLGGGAPFGDSRIVEVALERAPDAKRKLVIIEVNGALVDGATSFGGVGVTRDAMAMLRRAREDEAVAGVLLQLDTPGGSVTDADLLHNEVEALRNAEKPVVVLMGDLCASGGYYVAAAADQVIALPTSLTGSIGVMIANLNVYALLQRWGIEDTSVLSGPNKGLLMPTREFTEEHRALLQGVVDEMHELFVQRIVKGRNLEEEKVRALADGRLYTATQARELGLVDAIAYRDAAIVTLRGLAKGGPFEVVRYEREASIFDAFRASAAPGGGEAALARLLFSPPRAMFLYAPFGSPR